MKTNVKKGHFMNTQEKHSKLMEDFLLSSKSLLKDDKSQVIITQNTCQPFKSWNVEGAANKAGF